MNNHRSTQAKLLEELNLLGKEDHKEFLAIQCAYGIEQRGGSLPISFRGQLKRLSHAINFLDFQERIVLIHTEGISKN